MKIKKIIFISSIAALWGILFLFLFEAGCRLYEHVNKKDNYDFFVKVPFLEYRIAHSIKDKEDQATRYNLNSFGFRGKDFSREKPLGTYRIIAIGDSCTFGVGTSDDAHTYPALLETRLNQQIKGQKFEVINAGIPGYLCLQSAVSFLVELADYQPDMVIIYTGWNDLGRVFTPEKLVSHGYEGMFVGKNRWPYEPRKLVQEDASKGLATARMCKKWVYKIKRYFNKKKLFEQEAAQNSSRALEIQEDAYAHYSQDKFFVERGKRIFERCLDSLVVYAQSRGIKVAVTTLPQLIIPDMPTEYYQKVVAKFPALQYFALEGDIRTTRDSLYADYEAIIKKVSSDNNCLFIDAAQALPRNNSNIDLFYDHVHMNDSGNELFAETVYNGIKNTVQVLKQAGE